MANFVREHNNEMLATSSYTIKKHELPSYTVLSVCLNAAMDFLLVSLHNVLLHIIRPVHTGQESDCLLTINLIKMSPDDILLGELNMSSL